MMSRRTLVLELRLPVDPDGAADVPGVVGPGVDVDLQEPDLRIADVLLDPVGLHEDFGMRVSHGTLRISVYREPVRAPAGTSPLSSGMCLSMLDTYLKTLSAKIITPNPGAASSRSPR